jgi:uncharacterized protein (TIGR02996 family)
MTEQHALLAAILAAPAEDTPRLIYADWLDENPTPRRAARAELIRTQIELARTDPWLFKKGDFVVPTAAGGYERYTTEHGPTTHPVAVSLFDARNTRHDELWARQEQLLKKWALGWLPPSGRAARRNDTARVSCATVTITSLAYDQVYTFERGFLGRAALVTSVTPWAQTEAPVRKFFADLFQAHPATEVRFSVRDYSPEVVVRVGPAPGVNPGGLWVLTAGDAADDGEIILQQFYRDRSTLAREGPADVMGQITELEFERISEGHFEEDVNWYPEDLGVADD